MAILRATYDADWSDLMNRFHDRDVGNAKDATIHWQNGPRTWTFDAAGFTTNAPITTTAPIIAPTIGPSASQQHVLPAVPSDTVALLVAPQTIANKTMTSTTAFNAASGTPPFTVVSPTKVVNLDADMVDTFHAALAPVASTSTIPVSDTLGKLAVAWLPTSLVGGAPGIGLLPLGDATGHLDATWLPASLPATTVTGVLSFSPDNTVDIGTPLLRPRYVHVGSRVGIGPSTAPGFPLHVAAATPSSFLAYLDQADATNGTFCLGLNHASTGTSSSFLTMVSNGVLRFKFFVTGGLTTGAAADQGAGTINVTGNLYKNATAYNSPDFVFEHYYTGQVERFAANEGAADYGGLLSLEETEAFVKQHWHLPRIPHDGPAGIFTRADAALEHIESLYLQMFRMNDRLARLEAARS